MIITMDNFIWKEVSNIAIDLFRANAVELFAVHHDESESLLESEDEIKFCGENNIPICIEVGKLPKKYTDACSWNNSEKKLIDNYWYVRISDISK